MLREMEPEPLSDAPPDVNAGVLIDAQADTVAVVETRH